jgi:hypothetical protein
MNNRPTVGAVLSAMWEGVSSLKAIRVKRLCWRVLSK